MLIFCCSVSFACGEQPAAAPSPGETPTAEPASAPDLSYPGEGTGTAVAEAPPESPAEALPPEPGVPPPLEAVRIFLVELDRGGGEAGEASGGDTFGCGDRLRGVEVPVASEGLDTAGRIGAALRSLLAAEGGPETPGDLYSAFDRSTLTVERVAAVGGVEGLYRVELAGDLVLGGVCDNPRVRAQIEATARQFAGVEDVEIVIDGEPLEALLSGRG
ncbi:MAG TPA: GerMN domain-containing protein [Thermoanaerobaculia bacterium]